MNDIKSGKFEQEFSDRFARHIGILGEIRKQTLKMGPMLEEHKEKDEFIETAKQFALINIDSPSCIVACLRSGHIGQAHVLLRWFLEMCHLCYFLWKNPDDYKEWLAGKWKKPSEIGKFFEKMGLATWRKDYEEWSNIVHGNSNVVTKYHTISNVVEVNEGQVILVGQALRNLLFTSHKFTNIFGKLLQPHIGDAFKEIALRYNELEEQIFKLSDEQNEWEKKFMGEVSDRK